MFTGDSAIVVKLSSVFFGATMLDSDGGSVNDTSTPERRRGAIGLRTMVGSDTALGGDSAPTALPII